MSTGGMKAASFYGDLRTAFLQSSPVNIYIRRDASFISLLLLRMVHIFNAVMCAWICEAADTGINQYYMRRNYFAHRKIA
jgi:hypothetical protein